MGGGGAPARPHCHPAAAGGRAPARRCCRGPGPPRLPAALRLWGSVCVCMHARVCVCVCVRDRGIERVWISQKRRRETDAEEQRDKGQQGGEEGPPRPSSARPFREHSAVLRVASHRGLSVTPGGGSHGDLTNRGDGKSIGLLTVGVTASSSMGFHSSPWARCPCSTGRGAGSRGAAARMARGCLLLGGGPAAQRLLVPGAASVCQFLPHPDLTNWLPRLPPWGSGRRPPASLGAGGRREPRSGHQG